MRATGGVPADTAWRTAHEPSIGPPSDPGPSAALRAGKAEDQHVHHGLATVPTMKWIGVAVLVVIGIIAAFVAIEYLVVPFHSLPSYIPGHKTGPGHYHKRGAIAALIALIALGGAVLLAVRFTRPASGSAGPAPTTPTTPAGAASGSVDDLLAAPAPDPAPDEGGAPPT